MKQKLNDSTRISKLEASPFFANFTKTEIKELAKDSTAFENFVAGSYICAEGDLEQALFIILSGEAQVVKRTPNGQTGIVKLKTGSIVGELSLLRKGKRVSDVKALKETMVYKLTPEQIKAKNIQLQVKIKSQILNLVIRRYESLCEKYSELLNLHSA